jgi:hypothetical protein
VRDEQSSYSTRYRTHKDKSSLSCDAQQAITTTTTTTTKSNDAKGLSTAGRADYELNQNDFASCEVGLAQNLGPGDNATLGVILRLKRLFKSYGTQTRPKELQSVHRPTRREIKILEIGAKSNFKKIDS